MQALPQNATRCWGCTSGVMVKVLLVFEARLYFRLTLVT